MMTFRELCLIKAALHYLAAQESVPARVHDVATNAGQFTTTVRDAERIADKLDNVVFAERLIGNLRADDGEALLTLAAGQVPTGRTDKPTFTRQARFMERVCGFIRERGGAEATSRVA